VDTMDEALAIAKQCPGLDYGAIVEVRQIAEVCPMNKCAEENAASKELAHAVA
jgi:hypothetical protein